MSNYGGKVWGQSSTTAMMETKYTLAPPAQGACVTLMVIVYVLGFWKLSWWT